MQLSSGNNFAYKVLDSRTIEIYSDILRVEKKLGCNDIEKVIIGEMEISTGTEIRLPKETIPSSYKIVAIKAGKKGFVYLFTHLRNKTTEYLLPILDGTKAQFYYDSYLINAYIDPNLMHLWLRYRYSRHEQYKSLEKFITTHPCYIKTMDIDYSFVDYKFAIPSDFVEDVQTFLEGKYSKLSIGLKLNIGKFHSLKPRSRMLQILNKDVNLKNELEKHLGVSIGDVDLDDKPDASLEFLE